MLARGRYHTLPHHSFSLDNIFELPDNTAQEEEDTTAAQDTDTETLGDHKKAGRDAATTTHGSGQASLNRQELSRGRQDFRHGDIVVVRRHTMDLTNLGNSKYLVCITISNYSSWTSRLQVDSARSVHGLSCLVQSQPSTDCHCTALLVSFCKSFS